MKQQSIYTKPIYIGLGSSFIVAIGILSFSFLMKNNENQIVHQLKQHAMHNYVDFDSSMQIDRFNQIQHDQNLFSIYNSFKRIYEKNSMRRVTPTIKNKIPALIHIMWLGGKLPREYEKYVASWRHYHPDWQIIFWTDNESNFDQGMVTVESFDKLIPLLTNNLYKNIVVDVRNLHFDNRIFYDRAENYGEKSDILKWEIVYRLGGLYVDTDFECLKPFDLFHSLYDFYTGIQPLDTNLTQLGAALFAATPRHPILAACVEGIKNNQHLVQIVVKTGPIHFTKVFLAKADQHNDLINVALPASYFYPCGYEQKGSAKEIWCKPESYAVHHWAGSWLKPEAFTRSKKI